MLSRSTRGSRQVLRAARAARSNAVTPSNAEAIATQAPNRTATWLQSQRPRSEAMTGPRFDGRDLTVQPAPYAAIDLIAQQPVREVDLNVAVCDGNTGIQGHPKIYINLDGPGAHACTYCGLRFAQKKH